MGVYTRYKVKLKINTLCAGLSCVKRRLTVQAGVICPQKSGGLSSAGKRPLFMVFSGTS